MIEIQRENDLFKIQFLKSDISEEFLHELLKKLEIEKMLSNNRMTKEDAWELSEEIKAGWWENNKERFLYRSFGEDTARFVTAFPEKRG